MKVLNSYVSIILSFIVTNVETNILQFEKEIIISKRNNIQINQTLWFLTCLLCVEVIFYIITKLFPNKLIKTVVISSKDLNTGAFVSLSESSSSK